MVAERSEGKAGAIHWLSLAAAPTFAVMAVLAAVSNSPPQMLCSAGIGSSPFSGMVPMYLLMSLFHSAPWLKHLASGRARPEP
jgi:hypothetical protein